MTEYDVSIVSEDASRETTYSECQKIKPSDPDSCALIQVGERNCTGLSFCRKIPKGQNVSRPFQVEPL